ncbi:vWA domain-containing protein [Spongiactinospora gelatinilytica]|nr:vWA domain-containing protein [Spongiactinospora gelatinilytica]
MFVLTLLPIAIMPGSAVADPDSEVRPVRAVVLVDESGSLTDKDVLRERDAARTIALSELSPLSQVAVVGFGSSNGPGQAPVTLVCPLAEVATAQDRESLGRCVDKLHRRTEQEGNDTDHAAALDQAMAIMNEPDDRERAKIVFLLTDGRLDVAESVRHGPDPQARNSNAQREIEATLKEAQTARVQVWPLGFGQADKAALDAFAAGGWRQPCGEQESARPKARVARTSADVERSLLEAFAYARCAEISHADTGSLEEGGTTDLHVNIPIVATDGSIVVVKRDKRVQVAYLDPNGEPVPKQGERHESVFQAAGESGPVESLRIRNPLPGRWTVRLTSPAGVRRQEVSTTVMWQGALRASIGLSNPSPRPGERVTVRLRLQTRSAVITDPAALKPLRFSAQMSGDGFGMIPVELSDGGTKPDRAAQDGEYSGDVIVPTTATGRLSFLGRVSGPGVTSDERPYHVVIPGPADTLRAKLVLREATVEPGGEVSGAVQVTNDGAPTRLTLRLLDAPEATIGRAGLTVPAGESEHTFTLRAGRPGVSADGPIGGMVQVLDPTGRPVAEDFLRVTLRRPMPLWQWLLIAAAVVLVLAAAIGALLWGKRRAARRAADPSDLTLHLYGPDGVRRSQLRAPVDEGPEFTFVISGDHMTRTHDGRGYAVRRGGGQSVVVTDPAGRPLEPALRPGRRLELPGGLLLGVDDARGGGAAGGAPERPAYGMTQPTETTSRRRPMPGDDLL